MSIQTEQNLPLRLLLTGGGTGGHLFPAVATAQNLCGRVPGSRILFVGTRRKLDREHLERYGFSVCTVHSHGLKGKKFLALFKALAVLPLTFCQACYQIVKFRPHVVCGVGGYVTGPVVAAAWMLRIPTVIHEQNSVPGLANRKLGRLVDRVCVSLPNSETFFPPGKAVLTGNPVRSQILALAASPDKAQEGLTLLILGGSQGAHAINEMMIGVLTSGDSELAELKVIHQTGRADEGMVAAAYEKAGISASVSAFFTDMSNIYRKADLVISRAGATTLAELAVLGKPAILIPYPFAADNHQEKNGAWFATNGGALMLVEEELTVENLAEELKGIVVNKERRQMMSQAMRGLGLPNAADHIVDICLEMA